MRALTVCVGIVKRTAGADETNFRGTNLKIYGGTLGGPIIKNKLFTFTSYEHWNDASPLAFREAARALPRRVSRAGRMIGYRAR